MFDNWVRPLLLVVLLHTPTLQAWAEFQPPLALPAVQTVLAANTPLTAVVSAGSRLVAAGLHGTIVYSDDQGASWQQAAVPSQSDLTALSFPTPELGWAVGHDGLVLHSRDGGRSWDRQLDGTQLTRYWASSAAAAQSAGLPLESMNFPLLDVGFENARSGFAVGAFNLILRTEDGGQTWNLWSDRVHNPQGYHLYGVRAVAGEWFIVGEQGLLMRLDRQEQRFKAIDSPYKGSFFGLLATPDALFAIGLRGNVYRSADGGNRWSQVPTGVQAGLAGATQLADGSIALVSLAGDVLISRDQGKRFERLKVERPSPFFAVADAGPNGLALVGMRGVRLAK